MSSPSLTLTQAQERALRALEPLSPATWDDLRPHLPGLGNTTFEVLAGLNLALPMKDDWNKIPHWVITPMGRRWLAEHGHAP